MFRYSSRAVISVVLASISVAMLVLLIGGAMAVEAAAPTKSSDPPSETTGEILLQAHPQVGSVHYVASGGSDASDCTNSATPCATVQYAVDQADPGAEIRVATGIYTQVNDHGGHSQTVHISKTVIIRGGYTVTDWMISDPVANPTTLNAQGQGRVLYIAGDISPTVEGLHIIGGNSAGQGGSPFGGESVGGGVYIVTATANLVNNWLYSNTTADYGGGLFMWSSSSVLSDNIVNLNSARSQGGGMFLYRSPAVISGNVVISNIAANGGGFYLHSSSADLSGNTVASNTATSSGGGLNLWASNSTLSNNGIFSNTATYLGGGLYLNGTNATLIENKVISNTANEGGGLYLSSGFNSVTVTRNTISSNVAREKGGGLYIYGGAALHGNLVHQNSAVTGGGGLFLDASDSTLINNIIADNHADGSGSGLYIYGASVFNGASAKLLYTTVARNSGGDGSGILITNRGIYYASVSLTNTILVSHSVGVSVTAGNEAFLEATMSGTGAWANDRDWGGAGSILTGTIAVSGDPDFVSPDTGDYHIGPSSAAVDSGLPTDVAVDIDGDLRPAGFGYDMGADERPGPSLRLRKSAETALLNPGQIVTYTVAVSNVGISVATNVWLTDTMSIMQQPLTVTTTRGSCTRDVGWGSDTVCELGILAIYDRVDITITAQVTTSLPSQLPLPMRNTVWITATEAGSSAYADTTLQNCQVRLNDDFTNYDAVQAAVDASSQPTDVIKVAGYCLGVLPRDGINQTVYLSKTLTLQGGWNTLFTDRDVDLFPTTLNAQGQGRVLFISGSVSPVIEGFRVISGQASGLGGTPFNQDAGGGIYVITAAVTLSNSKVMSSAADYGGGLYLLGSAAALTRNSIAANVSDMDGAGLYLESSPAVLDDNLVISNTASGHGGGLYLSGSFAALTGGNISLNFAAKSGGGVYLDGSHATLLSNTIGLNAAGYLRGVSIGDGGGIYSRFSNAVILGNSIISNSANTYGGGVRIEYGGPQMSWNVVSSNTAYLGGGGGISLLGSYSRLNGNIVMANYGSAGGGGIGIAFDGSTLTNTLVADNRTNLYGAGIFVTNASPRLLHTTIARNSGGEGGVYVIDATAYLTNTILVSHQVGIAAAAEATVTLEGTLWGSGIWANGVDTGGAGTIVTGTHNLFAAPGFVDPDSGNYHIGITSAAIDSGVNAYVYDDIDGDARPQGGGYDIGSDEFALPFKTFLPIVLKSN